MSSKSAELLWGEKSDTFTIEQGVAQGCSLSPILLTLGAHAQCVYVCVCVCVCVRACVRVCVCLSAHAILAVRAIKSVTEDSSITLLISLRKMPSC